MSEPRNVWLVMGERGEYSDWRCWPESVWLEESLAHLEVSRLFTAAARWRTLCHALEDEVGYATEDECRRLASVTGAAVPLDSRGSRNHEDFNSTYPTKYKAVPVTARFAIDALESP